MRIAYSVIGIICALNCLYAIEYPFKHISTKDGLSSNAVNTILQDSKGFLWFGTENGLNRFDGYSFKIYRNEPDDTKSLIDNQIRALVEDRYGRLWIGTSNGLSCFDPVTETFQHFVHNPQDSTSITNNRISTLYYSRDHILWVGTENGLNKFDPVTFKNTPLTHQLKRSTMAVANSVNSITEDADGSIWIGMWWGGLKKINPDTLHITDFFSYPNIQHGLSNDNVLSVFCDNQNTLWVTTYMGGLRRMNPRTGQFIAVAGLENNLDLGAIGGDSSGKLWLRAEPGTLIIYNPSEQSRQILTNLPGNPSTISTGAIQDIFFDRAGIAWIATDKGISYHDPQGQKFSAYYHELNLGKRDFCTGFYQDKDKQIWIAVFDVGLVKYNSLTQKSTVFSYGKAHPKSINHKIINGIQADKTGNIWLATHNGICVIDPQTNTVIDRLYYIYEDSPAILNEIFARSSGHGSHFFWPVEGGILDVKNQKIRYLSDDGRISINELKIKCIIEDKNGDLWIGTEFSGLKHLRFPTGQVNNYVYKANDPNSISNNTINDIYQDKRGNIWLSTPNGLNCLDTETNIFTHYTKNQGLSADGCFSVKEDSRGNIWVLTSNGLDKLDPETGSITRYGDADGLSLNLTGLYQSTDGYIFGGHSEKGFYMFHPDSIAGNGNPRQVYITNFLLFNETVRISNERNKSPLTQSILETRKIVLNHRQSVFGFEFSSLNFSDRWKNRYAYKLDGFDTRWFFTDENNRRVTYTNLDPGTYVFNVKVTGSDDQNNIGVTKITITILPPPWKTWWAYMLYFIVFIVVLNFIRKYFADKQKLKHEIAIQKIQNAKVAEVAQIKQRFFTNISHEFRTPLTLISGPVDHLIHEYGNTEQTKLVENLHLIKRNSERLAQLTNQLLDIRKLETGSMKLEIAQGNLVLFLKNIAQGFDSLAAKKQIRFSLEPKNINESDSVHWFDPDKIHKIITNLLSNAFKFTPENGEIRLAIELENKHIAPSIAQDDSSNQLSSFIKITVEDSGIGIKKENQFKIFDRFFQVEGSSNRITEGTGIGLALSKELVMLHGGTINVESEAGKGSRFTIILPVDKDKLSNYTIVEANNLFTHPDPQDITIPAVEVPAEPKKNDCHTEALPLILLVEDNADIRIFLRNILSGNYRIEEAENGSKGLTRALATLPDLIISDVMMPEMDGFQFTDIIKTDERTSHIPVILLTSLASTDNIIKGLENDADEYITKPFNDQILLLKVHNLIQSRLKLKSRYLQYVETVTQKDDSIELEPVRPEIPDAEQIFLNKLMAVMEKYMDESEFGVQQFSSEIGMEASVFHRKLKALINQSPGEFIRNIRMKRAVQLLANKSLSIGDIAYMVGFGNNTSYFSTAFRKHFGQSPKEYQNS